MTWHTEYTFRGRPCWAGLGYPHRKLGTMIAVHFIDGRLPGGDTVPLREFNRQALTTGHEISYQAGRGFVRRPAPTPTQG